MLLSRISVRCDAHRAVDVCVGICRQRDFSQFLTVRGASRTGIFEIGGIYITGGRRWLAGGWGRCAALVGGFFTWVVYIAGT